MLDELDELKKHLRIGRHSSLRRDTMVVYHDSAIAEFVQVSIKALRAGEIVSFKHPVFGELELWFEREAHLDIGTNGKVLWTETLMVKGPQGFREQSLLRLFWEAPEALPVLPSSVSHL